ncbi:MAG: hypothetical protein IJR89_04450 [Clostridia bacterium]|nr:hypothetical protein [Clostridia bacterium]
MPSLKRFSALLLSALLLLPAGLAAAAAGPLSTEDPVRVGSGGYPRMTRLSNGDLIVTGETTEYRSSDNGATYRKTSTNLFAGTPSTVTTASGVTHTLTRANTVPIELPDGSMMIFYRCHTKNYDSSVEKEFYTSIRVMSRSGSSGVYGKETVLVESAPQVQHGYWEPYPVLLDGDTLAVYYSDDLNAGKTSSGGYLQDIRVLTYSISSGTWDTTPRVCLSGKEHQSRDGMPTVERLSDGSGFVMSIEAQPKPSSYVFCTQLWFSPNGYDWKDGVIVAEPEVYKNKTDNKAPRCSAPGVAVLPDGRIAVSYQENVSTRGRAVLSSSVDCNVTMKLILSKEPVSLGGNGHGLIPASKGISASFEEIAVKRNFTDSSGDHADAAYSIWNAVTYANGYLYALSGTGYNLSATERKGFGVQISRLQVAEPFSRPETTAVTAPVTAPVTVPVTQAPATEPATEPPATSAPPVTAPPETLSPVTEEETAPPETKNAAESAAPETAAPGTAPSDSTTGETPGPSAEKSAVPFALAAIGAAALLAGAILLVLRCRRKKEK